MVKVHNALAIIAVVLVAVFSMSQLATAQIEDITNLTGLHISGASATATPVFIANQTGTGRIAEFQDASTPIATFDDGGAVSFTGAVDLQGNLSDSDGTFTIADNVLIDGQADAEQLVVQGNATQTSNLFVAEASDGTNRIAVDGYGQVTFSPVADADTANYDNLITIDYLMTGADTKDRNYGLLIEGTRPAGEEVSIGDHDEAGLKIRVDTEAITTTTGTVLRAIDAEAKADNPDGTVYNLYGASLTAKSDTSAGEVAGNFIGLTVNAQNNATASGSLMSADLRLMRQAATEPTAEYVLQVRNSSTSGSGADAAIYVTSDYGSSATTDSMDYVLDASTAAVNTAEIRGSNGETLDNTTDTLWAVGGFLGLAEGATQDLGATFTITPTASYQPITNSTGGSVTSDTSHAIADGAAAGALLIVCNEDAQDMVLKDGANTAIGGDVTLTGGAGDCITMLWDGSNWVGLAVHDN